MWWNILPSWFITGGLLFVPVVASSGFCYLLTGSSHNRARKNPYYWYLILRDQRLTGDDPYCQIRPMGGLDQIKLDGE